MIYNWRGQLEDILVGLVAIRSAADPSMKIHGPVTYDPSLVVGVNGAEEGVTYVKVRMTFRVDTPYGVADTDPEIVDAVVANTLLPPPVQIELPNTV